MPGRKGKSALGGALGSVGCGLGLGASCLLPPPFTKPGQITEIAERCFRDLKNSSDCFLKTK